jgi:DNA ligase (NAD+)
MATKQIPSEFVSRHGELVAEINRHDIAYHQNDAPTISDADYDALRKSLRALESAYPSLASNESPEHRVGAAPSGKFAKVKHVVPMLSLLKIATSRTLWIASAAF